MRWKFHAVPGVPPEPASLAAEEPPPPAIIVRQTTDETRVHTFTGLYILGGLRWGLLFWDFANPIQAASGTGTETIDSDDLQYIAPYLGFGVSLVQLSHMAIGANLSAGYRIYRGTTGHGFDNNIFDNEGMLQLMFDVAFGPRR